MPRQAVVVDFPIPRTAEQRLQPPRSLDKPEAELFTSIVLAYPANRFNDAHMPLLCAYVRACVEEECASGELRACRYVLSKHSPNWPATLKEARRAMSTFARALRLSPASDLSPQAAPEISYYERMALGSRADDEPN